MTKQNQDNLLSSLPKLKTELLDSYKEIGHGGALLHFTQSISWYEFASYTFEELNGASSKVSLHVNDFITIDEEDFNESYAAIRGFFKHKGNDDKYYAFIVVDWFEDINQEHPILGCPLYCLRTIEDQRWRSVFPISSINNLVQKIHFVHNCNIECRDHYKSRNRVWIKNNYYFTAI